MANIIPQVLCYLIYHIQTLCSLQDGWVLNYAAQQFRNLRDGYYLNCVVVQHFQPESQ